MLTRSEAIARLSRCGIKGPDVYLLDLIPLIEMVWADGVVQEAELELLEEFVLEHVVAINTLAGSEILSTEQARHFASRFLSSRPDPALLEELRELVPPVRLSSSDLAENERRRHAMVEWCMDIGAACVAHYPYGNRERFEDSEKERFFSILRTLDGPRT